MNNLFLFVSDIGTYFACSRVILLSFILNFINPNSSRDPKSFQTHFGERKIRVSSFLHTQILPQGIENFSQLSGCKYMSYPWGSFSIPVKWIWIKLLLTVLISFLTVLIFSKLVIVRHQHVQKTQERQPLEIRLHDQPNEVHQFK